jgi:hypothetical protein
MTYVICAPGDTDSVAPVEAGDAVGNRLTQAGSGAVKSQPRDEPGSELRRTGPHL